MKSICVIGGGLIGAASALRLQDAGLQTTLIDPGDKRRAASYGNAGHIGSEQVSPWSSWDNVLRAPRSSFALGGPLDFRWRDAPLWGPWALQFLAACGTDRFAAGRAALTALLTDTMGAWTRLAHLAGRPDLVIPHGHVTAWMTPAGADAGRQAFACTAWGSAAYRDMTDAELTRYEAVLRRKPHAAVLFSNTGQVSDPQATRDAILSKFAALGGETCIGKATRVEGSGRLTLDSGEVREVDALLIAAGAWSRGLMAQLGVRAPLIGERGYSVQSAEHNWPADLPTTVFDENFVVFSRFTTGLRATSFIEFGEPSAPGDPRKWRTLERRIRDLGVQFSAAPDRWVGARPTLPDYVPAIGRLKSAPKVLYAFGHAHLGLTMSAFTSELITALATGREPPVEMSPYRIERFS